MWTQNGFHQRNSSYVLCKLEGGCGCYYVGRLRDGLSEHVYAIRTCDDKNSTDVIPDSRLRRLLQRETWKRWCIQDRMRTLIILPFCHEFVLFLHFHLVFSRQISQLHVGDSLMTLDVLSIACLFLIFHGLWLWCNLLFLLHTHLVMMSRLVTHPEEGLCVGIF